MNQQLVKLQERRAEAGFTLVELAIVLVIIGLIIGGVLVGQDLIKAAELRATSSNIEKYNSAANTFRNRFNGLPGDLLADRASQNGLADRDGAGTAEGTAGKGDGNGVMEGCATNSSALGCETGLFWADLTVAQLVADSFTVGAAATDGLDPADDPLVAASITATSDMSRFLPSLPIRDTAFVHIFPQGGRNYYYLGSLQTDAAGDILTVAPVSTGGADSDDGDAEVAGLAGLTPAEAAQLDDKVDDGGPTTGIFRAAAQILPTTGATIDPGATGNVTQECVSEGAAATIDNDEIYNTANQDFANELNCNAYWRASF